MIRLLRSGVGMLAVLLIAGVANAQPAPCINTVPAVPTTQFFDAGLIHVEGWGTMPIPLIVGTKDLGNGFTEFDFDGQQVELTMIGMDNTFDGNGQPPVSTVQALVPPALSPVTFSGAQQVIVNLFGRAIQSPPTFYECQTLITKGTVRFFPNHWEIDGLALRRDVPGDPLTGQFGTGFLITVQPADAGNFN